MNIIIIITIITMIITNIIIIIWLFVIIIMVIIITIVTIIIHITVIIIIITIIIIIITIIIIINEHRWAHYNLINSFFPPWKVFGSEGMVRADNPRERTRVVDVASGSRVPRLFYSFPQRFEKAFQLEVDHFVRCMEGTSFCLFVSLVNV